MQWPCAICALPAMPGWGWLSPPSSHWSTTAWSSLAPFVIGLILMYLLSPFVNLLNKRLPRWLSILLVYIIAIAAIVGFVLVIVPPLVTQTQRLIAAIPDTERLQGIFNESAGGLSKQRARKRENAHRQRCAHTRCKPCKPTSAAMCKPHWVSCSINFHKSSVSSRSSSACLLFPSGCSIF